jgi:uncharacterized protein
VTELARAEDAELGRADPGEIPGESDLCVACGMCCDGTYLTWAPIVPGDDLEGLQSVDHPVLHSDERGMHFTLPCPALVDKCCMVYAHRPTICPTYRCTLLRRFGRGEIDSAQALDTIHSTLEVRDRVRDAIYERLDVSPPRSLFELFSDLQATYASSPDPVAARRDDAELLIDIGLLRRLLSRNFEASDPVAQPVEMRVR